MSTQEALARQVAALEARVSSLESALVSANPTVPVAPSPVPPPPVAGSIALPVTAAANEAPTPHEAPSSHEAPTPRRASLSEGVLRWTGIGLVFLAAAFLLSTAVRRGWIGPEFQLAASVGLGGALGAWSLRLRATNRRWALAAGHGSVAVLGLSVLLGHLGLDLYGLSTAMAATAACVAVTFALGIQLGRASVVSVGCVQAVLVPLLVGAFEEYSTMVIALWLAGLMIASAQVGWQQRWPALRVVLFGVVAGPMLFVAAGTNDEPLTTSLVVLTVAGFAIITFVAGPLAECARGSIGDGSTGADRLARSLDQRLWVALPTWSWGLFASVFFFDSETAAYWSGLALAALWVLGIVAAERSVRTANARILFAAGCVGASVLASISLTGLIDGPSLLVALAVQAVGLTWLAVRLDDLLVAVNAAVVGLIAGLWAGTGILVTLSDGATWGQHVAYLVAVIAAGAVALLGRGRPFAGPLAVVAWIGSLAWIAGVLGDLPQGQMMVSIAWALLGAGLFVVGLSTSRRVANVGLGTLAVMVAKLVTVDLEAVDTMWRAGLFLVVGLGLLRLGLWESSEAGSGDQADLTPPPVEAVR